jgi:hypothetical protein
LTETADFALVNARIRTPGIPGDADALAARDGRVIAIGRHRDIAPRVTPRTTVLDAECRRAVPGLTDAHLHFVPGGLRLTQLDLSATTGRDDLADAVRAFARANPDHPWILGGGWSDDRWGDHTPPHRDGIDAVTPHRPAFLYRLDCHAALANSAALRIAGIDDHGPPHPPGGRIGRDAAGRPTGLLRDAAMKLVTHHIPPPTDAMRRAAIDAACRHANENGLTMVHNMLDAPDGPALEDAARDGRLTVRLYNILHRRPDALAVAMWRLLQPGDDHMRCGGAKNYMDGSLGSRTAWMLHPYAEGGDDASPRGLRVDGAAEDDDLLAEFLAADDAGLQLITHAIGDAAVRELLRLYIKVARMGRHHDRRPRVEHAQHVDPADIARFAIAGAVASMQPMHKFDDAGYVIRALGAERARHSYPFADLLRAGVVLAFGSDWPIATLNPFEGIAAAVTGRTRTGDVWLPGQNICVRDALRAYTTGPAFACFGESATGHLRPGAFADITILDRDLLTIPPDEIHNTRAWSTIVNGRVTFSSP